MGEAKRRKKTGKPAPGGHAQGKPWLVIGVVAVILAVIGGVFYVTRLPAPDADALPVAAADAKPFPTELDQYGVSVGSESAPVVVREFADYQCPACGRFSSASERLRADFVAAGQVRFVYFDFPLDQHANAMPAAEAARCAGDQGKYWPMQERLFANQADWSESGAPVADFSQYASSMGMDERRFRQCMTTELHREDIMRSHNVGVRMKVTSTPTVMVNNIRLTRPGWPQLSGVVNRELSAVNE